MGGRSLSCSGRQYPPATSLAQGRPRTFSQRATTRRDCRSDAARNRNDSTKSPLLAQSGFVLGVKPTYRRSILYGSLWLKAVITRESHQHLMITPAAYDTFPDGLQQTLDKFSMPQADQPRSRQ